MRRSLMSETGRPLTLAALKTERAGVAAQGRQIETEATPIMYAAEVVGIGADPERAICALTGTPIDGSYIKAEGTAGRIGVRLMAIAAEGHRRRSYVSPTDDHEAIATAIEPSDHKINLPTSTHPQYMGAFLTV